MREGIGHGAGHGTGAMAGITDGLDRLIGHNGLIRLNGQTRHNGRYVARTISLISRGKPTIHQELAAQENGAATTGLRNGPKNNAKRTISHDEMGCFGG